MIEVILYSREDCHLCEQAKAELDALQAEIPHLLTVIDIDSDPKLQKQYGFNVPVVSAGPYHVNAPITRQDLIITLRAAQQRELQITRVGESLEKKNQSIQVTWTGSDQFSTWISKHYLAVFNVFIAAYLGMAFFAPVLMKIGATTPATWIYRAYGVMCHELAFRSWFLFGEQYAYPRSSAGVERLVPYSEATGLDENDLWDARRYIGDDIIGFKVALCQRDVAIYASILLFGLLFSLTRRRLHPLHWAIWLVIGILPIAIDGLSQLISQLPIFNLVAFRESTPFLRTLTGFLFGFMTAWFGYPLVEESMRDTRKYLESKQKRIQDQKSETVISPPSPVDAKETEII
jgi:uncharacterized membrane protein